MPGARDPGPRMVPWERMIANLAAQQRLGGRPSEWAMGFGDPALARVEAGVIAGQGVLSRAWLLAAWPLLARLLRYRRPADLSPAYAALDAGPEVAAAREIVSPAWQAGEARANGPPAVGAPGARAIPGARVESVFPPPPQARGPAPAIPPPEVPQPPGRPPQPPEPSEPPKPPPPSGPPQPPRPPDAAVMRRAEWYARTSAAAKMREWADGMRDDVRWQTVQALREGVGPRELAGRLTERWERHGQNFALIAATELADAYAAGMLLALAEGSFVTVPPIGDDRVCAECRELLEARIFEVRHIAPPHPSRFERETQVWPGKSNAGKSRDRWDPCITLHPRCRHLFIPFSPAPRRRKREDES